MMWFRRKREEAPKPSIPQAAKKSHWYAKITDSVVAQAARTTDAQSAAKIFAAYNPPPGVLPKGTTTKTIAMDSGGQNISAWAPNAYAAVGINSIWNEGLTFLGYAYLSELAQRPEYRRISEVISTEMTRKWIKIQATDSEDDKSGKVKQLEDALDKFKVRECFQKAALHDGFFGRSHLFLDFDDSTAEENRDELKTPVGNGRNAITLNKVGLGSLKRIQVIEPIWCYPSNYNANDPMKPDWYKPVTWFVMAKEVHQSRLLTFVGREVPDILKPAYAFGGLSMSQMAKPYVDNWVKTRQSVSNLIQSFSFTGIKTNLGESLMAGGELLFKRLALLTNLRNNQSTIALNQGPPGEGEEFFNVSVPLGTLDALQAQAQEHMAAVSGIPLTKLLGITPHGLNASSEGEIRAFYDYINAYQYHLFGDNLTKVIDFIQISEFGSVDPDLKYTFEPLWSLDDLQEATKRKTEADVDALYIQEAVLSPKEVRARLAADPETPYQGLDVDDVPEPMPDPSQESDPGNETDDPVEGEGVKTSALGAPKHIRVT